MKLPLVSNLDIDAPGSSRAAGTQIDKENYSGDLRYIRDSKCDSGP
jgi:hypothetical protein